MNYWVIAIEVIAAAIIAVLTEAGKGGRDD
jgi:hypothetical protein